MYNTSDIGDLCSKNLPFTTINNQLEIHQHTKGESPINTALKNTEPEIISLYTENLHCGICKNKLQRICRARKFYQIIKNHHLSLGKFKNGNVTA
jgi:hypothetical protein